MYVGGGVDTLCLAVYTEYLPNSDLDLLSESKARAIDQKADAKVTFGGWDFAIRPNGANGYAYVLRCVDMRMQVGDWNTPKTRPSIMVDLRSEFLWRVGVYEAIATVHRIVEAAGGTVMRCVPSRVDVCSDLILPEGEFTAGLIDKRVTRSDRFAIHGGGKTAQTLTFGSGQLLCRIYDKAAEIAQASGKDWFYGIWGINAVPEGAKIIRVEFQIRREKLSEMGINDVADLLCLLPGAWSYLTTKWLKLVSDPERHVARQHLLPWWETVQKSFTGGQKASPIVLGKAVAASRKRALDQIVGHWTTLAAIEDSENLKPEDDFTQLMIPVVNHAMKKGVALESGFRAAIEAKVLKYQRQSAKHQRALKSRAIHFLANGLEPPAVSALDVF